MNKSAKIIGFVVLLVAGAAMAMSGLSESGTWRYKITVSVETPEGLKTGSAVREVSNSASPGRGLDWPGATNPAQERGEAVVVDLGERGILFALISSDSDQELYTAFPTATPTTWEGIRHFNSIPVGSKSTLEDLRAWPVMVTFEDMNDPKSVKQVLKVENCYPGNKNKEACKEKGPHIIENNMEAFFGEGVKIKNIIIEMVDEPVTWGRVEQFLPQNFNEEIIDGWRELSMNERGRLSEITTFRWGQER